MRYTRSFINEITNAWHIVLSRANLTCYSSKVISDTHIPHTSQFFSSLATSLSHGITETSTSSTSTSAWPTLQMASAPAACSDLRSLWPPMNLSSPPLAALKAQTLFASASTATCTPIKLGACAAFKDRMSFLAHDESPSLSHSTTNSKSVVVAFEISWVQVGAIGSMELTSRFSALNVLAAKSAIASAASPRSRKIRTTTVLRFVLCTCDSRVDDMK